MAPVSDLRAHPQKACTLICAAWCGLAQEQHFVDAVDRVVGDAGENIAEVGLGIATVEHAGFEEGVDRGSTFVALVRSGEDVILSAQGGTAQCTLAALLLVSKWPGSAGAWPFARAHSAWSRSDRTWQRASA